MAVIWKGLTVKHPHVDLLAIGSVYGKQYETRSKPTKYRGPVVIHAGKARDVWNTYGDPKTEQDERWSIAVSNAFALSGFRGEFIFGAIIAYADIVGCYPVEDIKNLSDRERLFGDWTAGRYAWEIAHVRMVHPLPYKGQLGLWNIPHNVVRSLKELEAVLS